MGAWRHEMGGAREEEREQLKHVQNAINIFISHHEHTHTIRCREREYPLRCVTHSIPFPGLSIHFVSFPATRMEPLFSLCVPSKYTNTQSLSGLKASLSMGREDGGGSSLSGHHFSLCTQNRVFSGSKGSFSIPLFSHFFPQLS